MNGSSCPCASLSRLASIAACAGLLWVGSTVAQAVPLLPGLVAGDPASDDFERPTLGNQWTIYNGNPHIVGSSDFGADPGLNIATWTANTFSADQFSECELSNPLDTTQIQVFVRRTSGAQRYGFVWVDNTYPECGPAWSNTVGGVILKLDGAFGAPTLTCVERPVVVAGDVLRIEARGEFLTGFVNGEQTIQTTDRTLTQPGEPGIAMAPFAGTGNDRVGCERWGGGSLQVPEADADLVSIVAIAALGVIAMGRRGPCRRPLKERLRLPR